MITRITPSTASIMACIFLLSLVCPFSSILNPPLFASFLQLKNFRQAGGILSEYFTVVFFR
jgi:hypothetical protein